MRKILLIILVCLIPLTIPAQPADVQIRLDGSMKFRALDGFGVNINPAWWYNGKYEDATVVKPAIDLLVDSLGATIYRAVIEEIDWEAENDDDDPNHFNWDYYNRVFSGARFQGVWNTLRYLNRKGITDGLMISFMGAPPAAAPMQPYDPLKSWMGGTDNTIRPDMEKEMAETLAALLYYMRHTAGVQFTLVSPMNETDIQSRTKRADHPDGVVEGPNIPDAVQYVRIVRALARKLDALGMEDVRFVAPDGGYGDKLFGEYLKEVLKDPYLLDKMAHWGVHEYGKDADHYRKLIDTPDNPNRSFWVTETAGIRNLFGQLDDDAGAYIFWDGFDCVYQHGRRNGYGDVPPNDWVFWEKDEGRPLIEFQPAEMKWIPRKQFYQFAHVMKFVRPGSVRFGITGQDSTLSVFGYSCPDGKVVITGRNNRNSPVSVNGILTGLPVLKTMKLYYTNSSGNFMDGDVVTISGERFKAAIPAESVFTITGTTEAPVSSLQDSKPEPHGWYAGDMHVHRNCGESTPILPENELTAMMEFNDLAVISVLADMGDGEVKDSKTDLPRVNGKNAVQSEPGRTVQWDAEWHFDPAGTTFENKALGGHIVLLGLTEAHTIWDESPYKILEWGRKQNGIVGFCHMQYLKDSIPSVLDCCTPIDFPVEAALGTLDFLAEDVWLSDASVNAYYRLLNCGFRLGWAAGTDYPCNNSEPFGSLLTYVQVKDQPFTYRKWVEGIRNGRTVVSTNGHKEFLELKVNRDQSPGDEIRMKEKGTLDAVVTWTSVAEQSGRLELVCNGKVVASQAASASPGKQAMFKASIPVAESSWICARRMDDMGHQSHTAPVYITVRNAPVRASAEDARYFVTWIDTILDRIAPGEPWSSFFTHDLDAVKNRYLHAKSIYEKIAREARN